MIKLYLDDYTPAMKALHQILTGTLIYSTQRKKNLPPPTFTDRDLKEGLRRSWTAELIGHLLVKYESEWYADEALSKWNEIDDLFEEEKQQQKSLIEAGLDEWRITELYQRDIAMKKVDEAHEHVKKNWQLEKAQRIKPSLWWQQVAQVQAQTQTQTQTQTTSTEQSNANTPKLSNLSADGKAWFIHPVALFNFVSLDLIDVESFLTKYESEHKNFKANEKDVVSDFNQKSKDSLRGIIKRINLFYKEHEEFKPNIYYVSYMLATARWEEIFSAHWKNVQAV